MFKISVLLVAFIFSNSIFAYSKLTKNLFECISRVDGVSITGEVNVTNDNVSLNNFFYQVKSSEVLVFQSPIYINHIDYSDKSLQMSGITFDKLQILDVHLNVSGKFRSNVAKGTLQVGDSYYVIYDTCNFNFVL